MTALDWLPRPAEQWEAATWLYAYQGDSYYESMNDSAEVLIPVAATKAWYKTITKFENFSQGVPASGESIAKAERSLGVVFPSEYVNFLRKFGFTGWFGHAINGIIDNSDDEMAEFFDVVTNTQAALERKLPKNYKPVPDKCIVLEQYDAGGLYLLCCNDSDYGKVLLITHASKYDVEREWTDFDEFAEDHLLQQ